MTQLKIDIGKNLTRDSLIGLGVGLTLGVLGYLTESQLIDWMTALLQPLGSLWINALQMTVLPLVVVLMLSAVTGSVGGKGMGSLGTRTFLTIVAILFAGGAFVIVLAPPILSFLPVSPETVAAIEGQTVVPASVAASASGEAPTFGSWVSSLLAPNLFLAATQDHILSLLIFSVLLGLAIVRLPDEHRAPLTALVEASTHAMLKLIGWILVVTPIGVFIIALGLGGAVGASGAGILGSYVLFSGGFRASFALFLYPVAAIFGVTSIRRFAKASAPSQLVAISTRSSIASLPAMVKGGKEALGFPPSTTGFVLPLCVAACKANTPVGAMSMLYFLGHIYGMSLGFGQVFIFLITINLLSFARLGVPSSGPTFQSLPAFLAAGVPIEGYVMVTSVRALIDAPATLLNVTGDMTVATVMSRGIRDEPAVEGAAPATG